MSNRNIPQQVIKSLWSRSGGRCAMCKTEIILQEKENNPSPIGEMAHIKGLNSESARYDPNMSDEERNSYENLIILCPTCHTKIDKYPSEYTSEKLKQIKIEHEKWVQEQLKSNLLEVTFAELEVITKYLVDAPTPDYEQNLEVIPPKEKIMRNGLSREVENLIRMGMLGIDQVKEYLNKNPDPEFADRLRNGFVRKYLNLKKEGLTKDSLFYELLNFASANSNDFKIKAAGLKILTYFFEICEVFEK